MWRFVCNIPRALRQHIHGSSVIAPHAAGGERDESTQSNVTSLQKYHTTPVSIEFPKQGYHDYEHSDDHHGDKRPRFDYWYTAHRRQHGGLEAIQWGASVLLAIHLSHYAHLYGSSWDRKNQPRLCGLLYRVADNLPVCPRTARQCLTGTAVAAQPAEEKTPITVTNVPEETADKKEKSEPVDYFAPVFEELDKCIAEYCSTTNNAQGLKCAEDGDIPMAMKCWKQASDFGNPRAQYNLALCYHLGKGTERNLTKAIEYYSLAATSDHRLAIYNLATILLERGEQGDLNEVFKLLKRAADLGLSQAQTSLGVYYTEQEHSDMVEAATLFAAAAEQQDTEGEYFLGICYEHGWGVERCESTAIEMYRRAGQAGHPSATYNLAVFHEHGSTVFPSNPFIAEQLYQEAHSLGHVEAGKSLERLQLLRELQLDENSLSQKPPPHTPPRKPRQRLKSTSSSPSITDYIRKHLSDLDLNLGFHGDLIPRCDSVSNRTKATNQTKTPNQTKSANTKVDPVRFNIGDLDSDSDLSDFGVDESLCSHSDIMMRSGSLNSIAAR